jgi:hypothetical protein
LSVFRLTGPLAAHQPASAQENDRIQIFNGILQADVIDVYRVGELQPGQTLSALATNTSGNLDPILILIPASENLEQLFETYTTQITALVLEGENLPQAIYDLRDATFSAWDDDGGPGYAAYLEFSISQAEEYYLVVAPALSSLGRATSGGYQLGVGLDATVPLTESSDPAGQAFITFAQTFSTSTGSVEDLSGNLQPGAPFVEYNLEDIRAGDTLYVYAERTGGDFFPALSLRDFGDKPLTATNLEGENPIASLSLVFNETTSGVKLRILPNGSSPAGSGGEFRLQVGVNQPEVETGSAVPAGQTLIKAPIEVAVGVKLLQIVNVQQADEFFTAVGSLRMDWTDPRNAFSPDSCHCREKFFSQTNFDAFLDQVEDRWPEFSFANQQGNRWMQNRAVVLRADGSATYYELFTTNFQVDFDFRRFPFDVQTFLIRVDQVLPYRYYVFTELPGYSEISSEHGEDEFILTNFQTGTSLIQANTGTENSRFSFTFDAPRHLEYYLLQVFVPVLLITIISWVTFFLRDYTRRIEAAAANVLLFIAFSFSLTENYPRLGYLTFMDALMATTFIINTAVIVYNVYLKQLETHGRSEQAERIDHVMDWLYPVMYLISVGILYVIFFQVIG